MSDSKKSTEQDDDLDAQLVAENQNVPPAKSAVRGGLGTTDPSFADGAMEVDSKSMQPHPKAKK